MAEITQVPTVDVKIQFTLSYEEAAALDALAGYGADGFLKVFYEHLGRHYLEPHERGLRSLFEGIKALRDITERLETARRAFYGPYEMRRDIKNWKRPARLGEAA